MAKIAKQLVYDLSNEIKTLILYLSKIPQSATRDLVIIQLYLQCSKYQTTSCTKILNIIIQIQSFLSPIVIPNNKVCIVASDIIKQTMNKSITSAKHIAKKKQNQTKQLLQTHAI